MAENILILEPGDERAQKIAKAMASQTASEILQLLAEGPKSLTDIGERLSVPMNTAKYHVENLLEAGLISIAETRYSVKGREVKLYSLTNQLLIVAPRQSPVRSLILKYASLFGIVILATLGISVLSPLLSGYNGVGAADFAPAPVPAVAGREVSVMAAKGTLGGMDNAAAATPDTALAFFLGGLLVIFVLLCYEAWLWKKR
jgi:DNA-binding transcriptional ArsR family regulator